MKQSVALPVKVPEPVLHLHFVSRSDCWFAPVRRAVDSLGHAPLLPID
jgi:hypothetical protein